MAEPKRRKGMIGTARMTIIGNMGRISDHIVWYVAPQRTAARKNEFGNESCRDAFTLRSNVPHLGSIIAPAASVFGSTHDLIFRQSDFARGDRRCAAAESGKWKRTGGWCLAARGHAAQL